MNIKRIFNLMLAFAFAFSLLGMASSVRAQEPPPNPGIIIDEFPVVNGGWTQPSVITAGPDGNLWFTEWSGVSAGQTGLIGRMTTDGIETQFSTTGSQTSDIMLGPDGNIWFTEPLYGYPPGGYLAKISPTGQLTEYAVPTQAQFSPLFLTSGPDGNVWYGDAGYNLIVKYTLATGSFTEYPVPTDSLHGITFGPDGNIWFADYGHNRIGKMTPDGIVTMYPSLPEMAYISMIVTGPDGNLWFPESGGKNIGRITTNGDITEFPLPSGYGTSYITPGPDGNMWFTEPWNNKVGKITPTGQITEYIVPTENSVPGSITLGPDGNMWFTETRVHKIGRIKLNLNQPPVITTITAPVEPVQLGQSIDATVTFNDPDVSDSHTVTWEWSDNTSTTVSATAPSVTTSHLYTSASVYTVTATITDAAGASDTESYQYVVIYDPDGGFVTGGGWIDSPAAAYTPDPALIGKATFGFLSKYQKGANVPTGSTEFQFHLANMNFKSTSYDWLVVAGTKAQYKGAGTINGTGEYKFMLTAIDGSPDKFRIKIWNQATGEVIYDNQFGESDTADPATALQGGSIVIHKAK